MMRPLELAFGAAAPPPQSRQRTLLLITDGEVSNTSEVVAFAAAHAARWRVFTVGVGATVSHHLVEGVAAATGGASLCSYQAHNCSGWTVIWLRACV